MLSPLIRCEVGETVPAGQSGRDDRVTIKIERALGQAIETRLKAHPEWGINSVSEFIRRAIDRELDYRSRMSEKKVLGLDITSSSSPSDSRGIGP